MDAKISNEFLWVLDIQIEDKPLEQKKLRHKNVNHIFFKDTHEEKSERNSSLLKFIFHFPYWKISLSTFHLSHSTFHFPKIFEPANQWDFSNIFLGEIFNVFLNFWNWWQQDHNNCCCRHFLWSWDNFWQDESLESSKSSCRQTRTSFWEIIIIGNFTFSISSHNVI